MTELHIRESPHTTSTASLVKCPPTQSAVIVPFLYTPSDDGTDENLLILLHGLGDTHKPFARLGRQLRLPQTAVLALRAPEQVPFLYEESYQWYKSFDDLGEMIERPNPTPALDLLLKVVDHLTKDCGWPVNKIHIIGFAQGGSVAAEFGILLWKQQLQLQREREREQGTSDSTSLAKSPSLGSIVTISGPLLSYPTLSSLNPTPLFVMHDPPPAEAALPAGSIAACRKAYESVTEVKRTRKESGMPGSKESWEPIMRFWSTNLARRQAEGLYEVMSSGTG
ncbi:hypothetical protein BDZ94DRAFT_1249843 [Collybia nuda]|uniref:Phospholipase/carboxylesterase/thioesterase domain-containing protein n=1 Tax=Collybia nuda TaxID=64659 RepID=A0A9P5YG26_9AGAR|nr:hypothetical protein BDZ94DRAFT_1249843 [Collybia nuda]